MKRVFLVLTVFICAASLHASGSNETKPEELGRPIVFAANYPLYYICQRYSGDFIELIWPFADDEDPAFWEPLDVQIRELQTADLLILNGAEYEKWLEYSFIDPNLAVDSSSRFKEDYIVTTGGTSHSHGAGALHDHGATAFSLWLDLELYARQAEAVHKALLTLLPAEKEILEQRHGELLQELDKLDQSFHTAGAIFKSEVLLASHPIYQYFSRAYTGEVKSLLLEPDIFPSEEDWDLLADLKKENNSSLMIWEGKPVLETQKKLKEMDIIWVVISPGFNKPLEGDYLDILKKNLEELESLRDLNK
ncbi:MULTISPECIES: metal ABC transporter substrate-binding protein [unclassified Oceanispirochaeta]|uniref:metal ABC transporter substrate-binding protein n=1 Tax=unclassified Oceanispirochaeta TaxID=2635722 RepID=UPI0013141F46|nr:metal ABC transporter substrate-binding protein [Oceanispirochaeta sp. M1]MBF9015204.1 zinc ABC transporter substrate-binding protein [Oceanispirochaeta sp. M2]NPD71662.1 zinc ABC transporter substrate-binding protein [Oceanispirochaeta sp. M1]